MYKLSKCWCVVAGDVRVPRVWYVLVGGSQSVWGVCMSGAAVFPRAMACVGGLLCVLGKLGALLYLRFPRRTMFCSVRRYVYGWILVFTECSCI